MTEVERAAFHESGHAIARHTFGSIVRSIEIDDGGDGLTRVLVRPGTTPWQTAICALAGCAAEVLFCGADSCDHAIDTGEARTAAEGGGFRFERAREAARSLVAQRADDIAAVAAALLVRRSLSRDQFLVALQHPP